MTATRGKVLEETTEGVDAGAASSEQEGWHAIKWYQAHRNVRRLQARIVKATQDKRWGRVQALHRLLTHSYSGKVLAVKRVTENQGKRTPGVDGQLWNTPGKKAHATQTLQQRGYRPRPLRRIYIPKSNGKKRPLSIPTMKDRAMQALYLLALDPIAEVMGDRNSYGFRKERSTADAIAQCFTVLSNRFAPQWILEGDIKACFDRIGHEWLQAHIPMEKNMLAKWLKAGFMEKGIGYPTTEGTPQGGLCSPVLANLTLDGLEKMLREKYPQTHQKSHTKVNMVRYADDFIITGDSQALLEQEVKPLVETFMRERGLELSPEKTVITPISAGFDFLGQNLRKYDGKMLIKPSKKNVKAFLEKIRTVVKGHKQARAGNLICQLNPIIHGWTLYHRHVASAETFAAVDAAIFKLIWQWAKRRHPHKHARWIRAKYFQVHGSRAWAFSGEVVDPGKQPRRVWLFSARTMPIRRHIKVRQEANPYDPNWEVYFEQRLGRTVKDTLLGERRLRHLWTEQQGFCPVCHQKITTATGWHIHHIVWRSKGGKDTAENQVLLHPNCHRLAHSQQRTVGKPRLERGDGEA